jgi:predicted kinase
MLPSDVSPTISILVGLPGSGKSTYVQTYLKEHPETVIASSDDLIQAYADFHSQTYSWAYPLYVREADRLFKNELSKALAEGKDIIVDRTNMTIKSRNRILANVPKKYHKIAVIFSVDEEELKKRLMHRDMSIGKHIPDNVINDMKRNYQEPALSEGFDELIFRQG